MNFIDWTKINTPADRFLLGLDFVRHALPILAVVLSLLTIGGVIIFNPHDGDNFGYITVALLILALALVIELVSLFIPAFYKWHVTRALAQRWIGDERPAQPIVISTTDTESGPAVVQDFDDFGERDWSGKDE